jgi:ABC-2 type transport system permease protein
MNKMSAFLLRDLRSIMSYRLRFFMQFASIFVPVVFIFFIGKTFQGAFSLQLERYGSDYFAFAILGMAMSSFVSTGLYSFSGQIRSAQVEGTLEALLMTPTSVYTILIGNSLWSFLQSFFESFFYIMVSILILKLSISIGQIIQVLAVLGLTFGAFLSIGLVSASFTLVFKQGNPINALFGASSYILGGILFPVEVLPSWIRWVSNILPMTHSGKLIRELLLVGPESQDIQASLLFLLIFTLIVAPIGLFVFNLALKQAKKDGSLVQY